MRTARGLFDGVRAAFTAYCVYGAFLLSVCALTNLVVTLESDGPSLSASTAMASSAFLMSEGTVVHVASLRLGLMPLGLTLMLVLVLSTFLRRSAAHWQGFLGGLAAWTLLHLAMLNLSHLSIEQGDWTSVGYADACYLAGFLMAIRPQVAASSWLRGRVHAMLPAQVRSLLARGGTLALRLIVAYLAVGLATVVGWVILGHGTVARVLDLSGMPMGSRIITSLISLAWLPNMMIWAIAWIFGAGFHIGAAAAFTMWSSTSTGLPPLPAFGILPAEVSSDTMRFALLAVPVAVTAVVCCVDVFVEHRRELMAPIPVGPDAPGAHPLVKVIARVMLPLLVMIVGMAVLVLTFLALFSLGNGTLGTNRLDGVGVDMSQALHAVGRPAMTGCGIAWLVALLVLSARYGWQAFHASGTARAKVAAQTADIPDSRGGHDGGRANPATASSTATADAPSAGRGVAWDRETADRRARPSREPQRPQGPLDKVRGLFGSWNRNRGADTSDGVAASSPAPPRRPRRTASSARRGQDATGGAETRSGRAGASTSSGQSAPSPRPATSQHPGTMD